MITRSMFEYLEACARCEELELPQGEFTATYCKAYRKQMAVMSAVGTGLGVLLIFFWDVAVLFLVLGLCSLLLLPSFLSYKCLVNKERMQEEYFILFFKRKKVIYWRDVVYKKVELGGRNKSITLYNAEKKRLIHFDELTVGFERIQKLARRSQIKNIKRS